VLAAPWGKYRTAAGGGGIHEISLASQLDWGNFPP
jgi:hypothetical protein